MIDVKRLQNVYVVAQEMPAISRFYEQVFGFPRRFEDSGRWIQYEVQGQGFALACPQEGVPGQQGAVPVFEVADFDGVESSVRAAGGLVDGIRDMGTHGRVMSLRDPAGNALQLFCRGRGG